MPPCGSPTARKSDGIVTVFHADLSYWGFPRALSDAFRAGVCGVVFFFPRLNLRRERPVVRRSVHQFLDLLPCIRFEQWFGQQRLPTNPRFDRRSLPETMHIATGTCNSSCNRLAKKYPTAEKSFAIVRGEQTDHFTATESCSSNLAAGPMVAVRIAGWSDLANSSGFTSGRKRMVMFD